VLQQLLGIAFRCFPQESSHSGTLLKPPRPWPEEEHWPLHHCADVGEYSCTRMNGGNILPDPLEARRCRNFRRTARAIPDRAVPCSRGRHRLTSLRESKASGAAKEYGYGHP